MRTVLVTGGGILLDYHVIKRLNERGIRPRSLVLRGSDTSKIGRLEVDLMGNIQDPTALKTALHGTDTVLHMAYEVKPAGTLEDMHETNIVGTRTLLDAAEEAGVKRLVATSSVLAVGANRDAQALDESAEWSQHALTLPYVESRLQGEQLALARSRPGFEVVVVAPALTFGPEDYGPAPGGFIVKRVAEGRFMPTVDVGVGCVDVRDFAELMLLAAERGRPGQRYIACAHNRTLKDLVSETAAAAGIRPKTLHLPRWVPHVLITGIGLWYRIRRKTPPVPRSLLQLVGRHAWYDAKRAREELGWQPRPLQETLAHTVRWFRENPNL
jgi:dihydroflavonol-4-reductase